MRRGQIALLFSAACAESVNWNHGNPRRRSPTSFRLKDLELTQSPPAPLWARRLTTRFVSQRSQSTARPLRT